jgi:hypothetical protein
MTYDEKFAHLTDALEKAALSAYKEIVVPRPEALGDTYEEIVESLNRIADAGVKVTVVPRQDRRGASGRPN